MAKKSTSSFEFLDHQPNYNLCLVGGLEHGFDDFPYIGNFIIPTDFHSIIVQRGRSTTNQPLYTMVNIQKTMENPLFFSWVNHSTIFQRGRWLNHHQW